jgi:nucleoside-diphosphate-sugar epimerase
VLAYSRAGLIEGIALRYFNVFGPRQSPFSPYAAVIPLFLRAALEERPAVVLGDGEQTRDFTYVANVVDANIKAANAPSASCGSPVNVGAGQRTSLNQLVQLVREVTGRPLGAEYEAVRPGDVRDSLAGLERATNLIGYGPSIDLREGLQRTWAWMLMRAAFSVPAINAAAQAETVDAAGSY